MQEPILKAGALDFDMIGQLEAALESASSDALVQIILLVALLLFGALALHREHAFAHFQVQVFLAEARHRQRNAVMGLVGALDIVGRIGLRLYCRVDVRGLTTRLLISPSLPMRASCIPKAIYSRFSLPVRLDTGKTAIAF